MRPLGQRDRELTHRRLWDIETGQILRVFTGHTRGLTCLFWSGELIATGGNDRTIRVWNVHTGECLRVLEGHSDLVRTVAFDHQSGRLVSGSYDKTLLLHDIYDAAAPDPLVEFRRAHTSLVFHLSMTSTRLISAFLSV